MSRQAETGREADSLPIDDTSIGDLDYRRLQSNGASIDSTNNSDNFDILIYALGVMCLQVTHPNLSISQDPSPIQEIVYFRRVIADEHAK